MDCPDLYIGPDRNNAPPTPFWQNSAIQPPSTQLIVGVPVTIPVTVRNSGSLDSPVTTLQLYYADPQTGFTPVGQIENDVNIVVPGVTTFPAADGEFKHTFIWNPPAKATDTNGGHVCLLARVRMQTEPPSSDDNPCPQEIHGSDPTTDKLQGVRNVFVHAPPPPPPPSTQGAGSEEGGFMQFGFGAMNTLPDLTETRLQVKVLDPARDRDALRALVADPQVDLALRPRGVRFAMPDAVRVGLGRERVMNRHYRRILQGAPPELGAASRLSKTGPVGAAELARWLAPGTRLADAKGPIPLDLMPGEVAQGFVQVLPVRGHDRAAYAVQIAHAGADGRVIGGITVVFVPPHDYFGERDAKPARVPPKRRAR